MSYQMHIYLRWDPDIYFDVNDLPDPFTINIPLGITNNENSTLYFKATLVSPSSDWSDYDQQLGSVGSGASSYFIYTPKRAQPTLTDGEYDETITLKIEAYTDDTYSTLYGSQTVDITIHFFDHGDSSWTVLYHDHFDDASKSGWKSGAGYIGEYKYGTPKIANSHYISAPYSLSNTNDSGTHAEKEYDVGSYTKARIIFHVYIPEKSGNRADFYVKLGDKLIIPPAISHKLPTNKWLRICADMPVNTTTKLWWGTNYAGWTTGEYIYFDEIWVIAK